MWEILLATVISLSSGVRQPRQVPTAPFDYELSYKVENQYKNLDLAFRHDFEREDGDFFNDIRGELNYKKGLLVVIGEPDTVGEAIDDTFQDLSIYGIIAQIVKQKKFK